MCVCVSPRESYVWILVSVLFVSPLESYVFILGAASIIGIATGVSTLLENYLGHSPSFIKYHCIMHQESQCGKTIKLKYVTPPIEECLNLFRARGLNRRSYKE